MNTQVAFAVCVLGASGCGEVSAEVVDSGDANFLIDASADRAAPTGDSRPPDATGIDIGGITDIVATRLDVGIRDVGTAIDGSPLRDAVSNFDGPTPRDASTCVYERVVLDAAGQPRNAAGQIRYCWPGEALCFCDADNDCYSQPGYVARCSPGVADAGTRIDAPSVVDTGPSVDVPVAIDLGAPRDTGGIPGSDPIAYSGAFVAGSGRSSATITVSGQRARNAVVYAPGSRSAAPPLIVLFHGTGDRADAMFTESRAQAVADANGVVIVAPQALDNRPSDWDHVDSTGVWWLTYPNVDPTSNEDLLLTRALIAEARRRYNVDSSRVYAIGHSNGAFFATLVASALAERIAGYGTSSGGLIRCASRDVCTATATGTTCANLSAAPSQCRCTGIEKPVAIRTDGMMPPGYFAHATDDNIVSPYYTCALASRMTAVGATSRTVLRTGDGHSLPPEFLANAWSYLSVFHR